ncbi:MAG: hypothetical protein AABW81_02620 [Nanoarchaeota archaeon]
MLFDIGNNNYVHEIDVIEAIKNNFGKKALVEDFHYGKLIGTLGLTREENTYCLNDGKSIKTLHYHDLRELRVFS